MSCLDVTVLGLLLSYVGAFVLSFVLPVTVEFKLRDFWVGTHWKFNKIKYADGTGHATSKADHYWVGDIWICLIPCFTIHITLVK